MRAAACSLLLAGCLAEPARAAGGEPTKAPEGATLWLSAGAFLPMGVTLEGFGPGYAVEAGAGYRFLPEAAVLLDVARYTTSTRVSPSASLEVVGTAAGLSLAVFSPLGWSELYGFGGFGWCNSMLDVKENSSSRSSGESRLGIQLGGGLAIPLTPLFALKLEVRYGGSNATMFAEPAWIGGIRLTSGLRLTLPSG